MGRSEFDLLFRWCVGLGVDEPVWDRSTFSKNRDRLLDGDVAARFLAAILAQPRVRRLPSSDHFSVDLHVIGEDVAERLDVVPINFHAMVARRPRYGCRACKAAPLQASAPPHIVEAGLPTEALIAHVLVAKYADYLPLYRQAQIYARHRPWSP